MRLTVVGCGDAFNAGGRLHSAYILDHAGDRSLIDCGADTVLGLTRAGIDTNSIDRIVLTHLHGDHFCGVVFLLMQAAFVRRRAKPIDIFGPPGTEARVNALFATLYPGLTVPMDFQVRFIEMNAGVPQNVGTIRTLAFEVPHPSGAPSHALRFEVAGKIFAFTGDSGWTDVLIDVGRGADLYLMECGTYERSVPVHLNWLTIASNLDRIGARRTVLTHLSEDMLANRERISDARVSIAADGAVFEI